MVRSAFKAVPTVYYNSPDYKFGYDHGVAALASANTVLQVKAALGVIVLFFPSPYANDCEFCDLEQLVALMELQKGWLERILNSSINAKVEFRAIYDALVAKYDEEDLEAMFRGGPASYPPLLEEYGL